MYSASTAFPAQPTRLGVQPTVSNSMSRARAAESKEDTYRRTNLLRDFKVTRLESPRGVVHPETFYLSGANLRSISIGDMVHDDYGNLFVRINGLGEMKKAGTLNPEGRAEAMRVCHKVLDARLMDVSLSLSERSDYLHTQYRCFQWPDGTKTYWTAKQCFASFDEMVAFDPVSSGSESRVSQADYPRGLSARGSVLLLTLAAAACPTRSSAEPTGTALSTPVTTPPPHPSFEGAGQFDVSTLRREETRALAKTSKDVFLEVDSGAYVEVGTEDQLASRLDAVSTEDGFFCDYKMPLFGDKDKDSESGLLPVDLRLHHYMHFEGVASRLALKELQLVIQGKTPLKGQPETEIAQLFYKKQTEFLSIFLSKDEIEEYNRYRRDTGQGIHFTAIRFGPVAKGRDSGSVRGGQIEKFQRFEGMADTIVKFELRAFTVGSAGAEQAKKYPPTDSISALIKLLKNDIMSTLLSKEEFADYLRYVEGIDGRRIKAALPAAGPDAIGRVDEEKQENIFLKSFLFIGSIMGGGVLLMSLAIRYMRSRVSPSSAPLSVEERALRENPDLRPITQICSHLGDDDYAKIFNNLWVKRDGILYTMVIRSGTRVFDLFSDPISPEPLNVSNAILYHFVEGGDPHIGFSRDALDWIEHELRDDREPTCPLDRQAVSRPVRYLFDSILAQSVDGTFTLDVFSATGGERRQVFRVS